VLGIGSAALGGQLSTHSFWWQRDVATGARRFGPAHRAWLDFALVLWLEDLEFQSRRLSMRPNHSMP
jgi:hypothetical protein